MKLFFLFFKQQRHLFERFQHYRLQIAIPDTLSILSLGYLTHFSGSWFTRFSTDLTGVGSLQELVFLIGPVALGRLCTCGRDTYDRPNAQPVSATNCSGRFPGPRCFLLSNVRSINAIHVFC